VVPPASHRIPRVPWYSGSVARPQACSVRYGALTRCGAASQRLPLTSSLSLKRRPPSCKRGTQPAYNPAAPRVAARPRRFGLVPFRSPLLRESRLISSPHGTEMFQFPRFPPHAYRIQRAASAHDSREVAPFGFGWLFARLQLPIHVSPLSAPFVGSWPLGIHPTPCFAWRFQSSADHARVSHARRGSAHHQRHISHTSRCSASRTALAISYSVIAEYALRQN
jgi:hypothetical protein